MNKNIYDTASREAFEESNGILNRKSLYKRIQKSFCTYKPNSKYLIFLLEATDKEQKLLKKRFVVEQCFSHLKRTYKRLKLCVDRHIKNYETFLIMAFTCQIIRMH